jgi:periplasmic protein TonB
MPKGRDDWRLGSVISALVHLGIIVLLVTPFAMMDEVIERPQGAGGPGAAGGGGGGTRGTGSLRAELLRFVRVAPPPPAPVPAAITIEQPKPPPPEPVVPTPQAQPEPPKDAAVATMPAGTGGGTGNDNTTGTGPGSGGGVGTGVGTGRGSGIGPGTGGGNQANYPPTPIEIFIPPLPVPGSVKGHHLIAEFDVDETGKVLGLNFNETKDRGYNRRLTEVLRGFRFKAGTTPDGKPLRMKAQVVVDLY